MTAPGLRLADLAACTQPITVPDAARLAGEDPVWLQRLVRAVGVQPVKIPGRKGVSGAPRKLYQPATIAGLLQGIAPYRGRQ